MQKIRLFELANLAIVEMVFETPGDQHAYQAHTHAYDHAHYLARGVMDVFVNGEVTRYIAPAMIWIKAGTEHRQVAVEANTIGLCINAIRMKDGSGEPIDPTLVPNGVSPWNFGDLGTIPAGENALDYASFLAFRQIAQAGLPI
jgi:quercetin dioxygenase-like cupin family protein